MTLSDDYIYMAGMTLGTLICMPLSGILASEVSWESVFYVQGGLSLLWYVLWLVFVFDSPSRHPRISNKEKKFIEEAIGQLSGKKSGDDELVYFDSFPVTFKQKIIHIQSYNNVYNTRMFISADARSLESCLDFIACLGNYCGPHLW